MLQEINVGTTSPFDKETYLISYIHKEEVMTLEHIREIVEKQEEGEDVFTKIHSLYGNRISLIIAASIKGYSWEETNKILKKYNYGKLYSRNHQDVLCIYALNNGVDILKTFSWWKEIDGGNKL